MPRHPYPDKNVPGTVYLLHSTVPVGNERHQAQHYLGWVAQGGLEERLKLHNAGKSHVRIVNAFREVGGELLLVRTWEGTGHLERYFKHRGHLKEHCPLCTPMQKDQKGWRIGRPKPNPRQRLSKLQWLRQLSGNGGV